MFDLSLRIPLPGPRGVPLLNNLRFLRSAHRYALRTMAPYHHQPIVPVTAGNGSVLVARGEPAVQQLFSDNVSFHRAGEGVFNLPTGRPYSTMFEAVITANGAEHRRRKRMLMPAVHRTALEHYQQVFAQTYRDSRFAAGDGEPFDLTAELLSMTKTNMLRCLLGLDPTERHLAMADEILRVAGGAVAPLVMLAPWERPWTPYGRWVDRVRIAHSHLAGLIEQRRGQPVTPDALSIVCHATDEDGKPLTTEQVVGELHGLFAAGFETTAMTMTWALLTLMASPQGPDTLPLDLADDATLDAVLKESQRVLPAVPLTLPRRVVREVSVAGSPPLPAGALLFASAAVEHHDAEIYPDPYAFQPDRWRQPDNFDHPFAFFPFGIGARRCLGAAFAQSQARATLALMARDGRLPRLLSSRVDYRLRSGVVAAPRRPVVVQMPSHPTDSLTRRRVTGSVTLLWHR